MRQNWGNSSLEIVLQELAMALQGGRMLTSGGQFEENEIKKKHTWEVLYSNFFPSGIDRKVASDKSFLGPGYLQ